MWFLKSAKGFPVTLLHRTGKIQHTTDYQLAIAKAKLNCCHELALLMAGTDYFFIRSPKVGSVH